ncbi:tyrosine-type recombinase/integrase [Niveibacterium microcysteis]|uniref:Tyrosine-type recombinase/integrase n=1 Tax=Niveibacterium microcysteis TaxID=2811415 RepID=A0ABX7MBW2_9RHOO|nr:tyrosine-type recombinase/integrase [Niveibacterium microcysteis]QSI78178.1 tyrosine-type recombinase/integrase [Niveibacterium microcysteis]
MRVRFKGKQKTAYYYLELAIQSPGKRAEVALGSSFLEALRRYADLSQTDNAPPMTVIELLASSQQQTAPGRRRSTQDDISYAIKQLCRFFGGERPAPLSAVKPPHIRQYLDSRTTSPVRGNREVAWLSSAWNWARERGLTDSSNPCDGVKRNKERSRSIYIEDDELDAILAVADEPLKEAIELAYLIGQRPSDLRELTEDDLRRGVLEVRQSKTGAEVAIELSGALDKLIQRIRERKRQIGGAATTSLLVDEGGRSIGKAQLRYRFDKARKRAAELASDAKARARLLSIQFRDLRAKAATDKRNSEGLEAAQRLLGHEAYDMTEEYTRKRKGDICKPVK